jgi:response regulator RpfG family c-di-GMP phosphodiesterase/HAMP domain-containing protein
MMEMKLHHITQLNKAAIGILILIGVTIVLILYRQVFRPIDLAVSGFRKVAHGELEHQIPVCADNEIGVMAHTFNHLTHRIATLFRLTDRINQADTLDETLRFVYEDFPVFMPVTWVGVIRTAHNQQDYRLDRFYSESKSGFSDRERFPYPASLFEHVSTDGKPRLIDLAKEAEPACKEDAFIRRLAAAGLHSMFYLPLLANPLETVALVIASDKHHAYQADHLEFLTNIASQVGHSFEQTIGIETLVISTVKGLAKLAESRDPETGDHLFRMSHYSALIAEQLALTDKYRELITPAYVRDVLRFAPMHDIGKVGISDSILLKPGKLDRAEMQIMRQHPNIGADVLRRCETQMNAVGRSVFQVGIEIAEGHHEKFDGSGYPKQLRGEAIPLPARIVAVADVFDALTSKRPYKEAWPVDKALDMIRSEADKHFDPEVVAAFEKALPGVLEIYEGHKHV